MTTSIWLRSTATLCAFFVTFESALIPAYASTLGSKYLYPVDWTLWFPGDVSRASYFKRNRRQSAATNAGWRVATHLDNSDGIKPHLISVPILLLNGTLSRFCGAIGGVSLVSSRVVTLNTYMYWWFSACLGRKLLRFAIKFFLTTCLPTKFWSGYKCQGQDPHLDGGLTLPHL